MSVFIRFNQAEIRKTFPFEITTFKRPGPLMCKPNSKKLIENIVPEYSGRIVNFYGDGCLMLFDSSIKAVNCAKELQLLFVRTGIIPVRMGIHSGDVMMKADSVYGDSVNISSRIESMAVPGSVLMSKVVSDQIRNEKNVNTRSIGQFHFKNVDQPMEVFALIHPELAIPHPNKIKGKLADAEKTKFKSSKIRIFIIATVLILAIAAIVFWPKTQNKAVLPENQLDITILPFDVNGAESLNYLGEAIPNLLSTKMEGASGFQVADPNVVFGMIGDKGVLDLIAAQDFVKTLGTKIFVLGSVNVLGDQLSVTASLYDNTGKKTGICRSPIRRP